MKVANLFHNPKAGDSTHDREELIAAIEAAGFKCVYISTKEKDWDIDKEADNNFIAGGDGTVRKVAAHLLKKYKGSIAPITLIPLGTANNIASALNISGDTSAIVDKAMKKKPVPFDIGRIGNGKKDFFLESFGCGILANLMNKMKKEDHVDKTAEERLRLSLQTMLEIAQDYKSRDCQLAIDGVDHSGSYLMVEVMNIHSIGPNLLFNPNAHTGDGKFEIVLMSEDERSNLVDYLQGRLADTLPLIPLPTIQGSHIKIKWDGLHGHVDDSVLKEKKEIKVKIEPDAGLLCFMQ